MISIKISSRGSGRSPDLSQFLGNASNTFEDVRFHVNEPIHQADAWFVSEEPEPDDLTCIVPPDRVFFVSAETSWSPDYYSGNPERLEYLRQFAHVYTCHPVPLSNVTPAIPFLPWMINANHGPSINATHQRDITWLRNLDYLEKTKLLSVFCSTQSATPTHRLRLRVVEKLKSVLGDQLDWYGNGINPLPEKWEGIAPYRYHLVLENRSSPYVITEKLFDSYLGLAYPIYWGAPNVDRFFDPASLTSIDITNFQASLEQIARLISSDTAEQRLGQLLEAKSRVLRDYNHLFRMADITRAAIAANPESTPVEITLRRPPPSANTHPSLLQRVIKGATNRLQRG
jgi:hypothetical protein